MKKTINSQIKLLINILSVILWTTLALANPIDISGVDRASLIQELYRNATSPGLGAQLRNGADLPRDVAEGLIGVDMDYVQGRVMKIRVPSEQDSNELNTFLYNRDNGENAAEKIVEALRSASKPTVAESSRPSTIAQPSLLGNPRSPFLHPNQGELDSVIESYHFVILVEYPYGEYKPNNPFAARVFDKRSQTWDTIEGVSREHYMDGGSRKITIPYGVGAIDIYLPSVNKQEAGEAPSMAILGEADHVVQFGAININMNSVINLITPLYDKQTQAEIFATGSLPFDAQLPKSGARGLVERFKNRNNAAIEVGGRPLMMTSPVLMPLGISCSKALKGI